jgi:uncharacterized SAM-binding protein YcdF (DUF218 family)
MHFHVLNELKFFSVPSNFIACLLLIGLVVLLVFRSRSAALVLVIGAIALCVAALSPLGNVLLTPLEQRFPTMQYPDRGIDGIIVLGGSYDTISHGYMSTIVLYEDSEPMAVMVDLARRYPKARIIFSGGTDPSFPGPSEASIVKQYFVSFGIPAERISIEERSQTTEENAQFTANLIHPTPSSRWLLVTSAYHMPRAVGVFRKAGFNVIAFPVGERTHGWRNMWWPEDTATDNLRRVDIAVHEWLGLVDYRIRGYSSDWLARPVPRLRDDVLRPGVTGGGSPRSAAMSRPDH